MLSSKKFPATFLVAAARSRGLAFSVGALGAGVLATACSNSSSAPASNPDASADTSTFDGPPPPLGVPVASCDGCPVCGGVLASPTTGVTYCTQDCTADTDCPSGTGCVAALSSAALSSECIKKCTADSDCSGGFICRFDLATPGSYCWSAYPSPKDAGAVAVSEAGADAAVDSGDAALIEAGPGGGHDADLSDAAADAFAE